MSAAGAIGQRFGMLTVTKQAARPEGAQGSHLECRCDCGQSKVIRLKDLRYGNTGSCGCMQHAKGKVAMARPWGCAQ
jgi:hypothetical protein